MDMAPRKQSHPLPPAHRILAELVAIPSISSVDPRLDQGNLAVVERLAEWCESLGAAVEILPLPAAPGKANLLARFGPGMAAGEAAGEGGLGVGEGGPGGEGLVLAGHVDTVPFDEGLWGSDPFRLTERDGRLHGLGATDMKGFFAAALPALAALDPRRLAAPVTLLATADEEVGMAGARALLAKRRALGRHAVIGEPTGLAPVYRHKGVMMYRLTVRGVAGHSSDPRLGASAIEGMHLAVGALLRYRAALARRYQDEAFDVPVPTLNLGEIKGGDSPNRICAVCDLTFDLRPLPAMVGLDLAAELAAVVAEALAGSGLGHALVSLMEPVPPLATDRSAPVVTATEDLTGRPAGCVAFGTEAPFLTALGLDTVILGPGEIAQAHRPDEYVAAAALAEMERLLTALIARLCGKR
jgi:acetylornithine deacetylase